MSEPETATLEDYKAQDSSTYGVYSDYQNFDGEWLSKIPAHWDMERFRSNLGYIKGNKPNETDDSKSGENNTPYLSMEYLRGEVSSPKFANSEEEDLVLADTTDILLLWDGSKAGEFVSAKKGIVSSTMAKLVLKDNNRDYIYYQLKVVEDFLQNTTVGMGIPHVNPQILNNIKLAIPPKEEQNNIAEFLDENIRKVDELIDRKKELIQFLDEKRSVLITQAVTQGLGTDVVLEDSGVPGLGKIPADWDTAPLKYSSRNVTVGIVQKPSQYYVDEGVPALRSMNVRQNRVVGDELVYMSEEDNESLKGSQIYSGDLVCVRSGVNASTTAVVPDRLDGVNCIDLIIIRNPEGYVPEFLSYLMNSSASTSQIEAGTEGAAVQHFNVEEVKELVFPKPNLDEQREILDWLSPHLKEIDETKAKIQEGIERLKEYRTALITEAVTGQIDVRGEV